MADNSCQEEPFILKMIYINNIDVMIITIKLIGYAQV